MFEAVEFEEVRGVAEPIQRVMGEFPNETAAVEVVRAARQQYLEGEGTNYAWWVVRKTGATLAEFIADSKSDKEFVLDITTGQLVEV